MKTLTLFGSYRRNGNTARVVDLIEAQLRDEAGATECHSGFEDLLGTQQMETCRGCRVCFDRGEAHCPPQGNPWALKVAAARAVCGIIACFAT